jgi:hypothetical protein
MCFGFGLGLNSKWNMITACIYLFIYWKTKIAKDEGGKPKIFFFLLSHYTKEDAVYSVGP